MVSTQHTFFPDTPFTTILGSSVPKNTGSVQRVLVSSQLDTIPPPPPPPPVCNRLIDRVNTASALVLSGLSYHGKQPKSISDLLAMGANRNQNAITEHGIDETAAFHNDVAYFKVLLEAREKHRAAMRVKLQALRELRAKQRNMYKKRGISKPKAAIVAAALARAVANQSNANDDFNSNGQKWCDASAPEAYASPVSTDVDSESCSDFGDGDVYEKPVALKVA